MTAILIHLTPVHGVKWNPFLYSTLLHNSMHNVLAPSSRLAWDYIKALPKTCVSLAGVSASSQSPLAEKCENTHRKSKFWLGTFFHDPIVFSPVPLVAYTSRLVTVDSTQHMRARVETCTPHNCMNTHSTCTHAPLHAQSGSRPGNSCYYCHMGPQCWALLKR